jgi:hypothetical protein
LIWRLRQGRARFLALGASPRHVESIPRVGRGWGWLCWPVYDGGDWAAAGTPCAGQTPTISCSSEVESTRGRTTEALASFIGAGAGRGHGRGLARGMWDRALGVLWRVQGASNTWRCSSAHVQKLAEIANVRILAKNPAQTSSWNLWLSLVCEFQGQISPRSEDLRTPNLACLSVHLATKEMPNHVK